MSALAHRLVLALAALLLAACAGDAAAPAREAAAPPAPIAKAEPARASAVGTVDFSCTADADCAIKDVGNCCGAYPACVNVDSPTFPEQVKAQCEAEGLSSVCGYPSIHRCQCIEGRCEGVSGVSVAPAARTD